MAVVLVMLAMFGWHGACMLQQPYARLHAFHTAGVTHTLVDPDDGMVQAVQDVTQPRGVSCITSGVLGRCCASTSTA
jgi:hypothetical protein